MHRHVRNKGDPFCDPVELVEGYHTYSVVHEKAQSPLLI